ncbi:MAG: hypothetical protein HF309_04120 [Ignavibacteria bacterium]|jgi:tetratricopeptide (TPR) repeat protein|nr:hypothetical protein [Ignavibacteria bacterium]MCU7498424.1 hypothetical protein [Ignavibacteria bacterium]MCU7520001.1 hypothetical protein [Ignavibacteria bacterium]MCU7523076.1 hypothetical protein [Ignavibacteria bacterium]
MKKTSKKKKSPVSAKVFPYKVTFDALDKYSGDENKNLRDLLEELHFMSKESPRRAIRKLRTAISQYPNVPEFYNYLYIAARLAYGEIESFKVTLKALEKFPDYFFAKMGLAEHFLDTGELEKIPEIFNNKFDIKQLLPGREVFHISEVQAFLAILIQYYAKSDNFGAADKYFSQLESVNPESPFLDELEEMIFESRLEAKVMNILWK